MANKIRVKLILELRSAGMSRNLIASTRHISRNSVSDVFRIADERGIGYKDIQNLSPQEVYRLFYPDKHSVESMYLDPDYERFDLPILENICLMFQLSHDCSFLTQPS